MLCSIKFFIRDQYYALINHLWRRLYRAEHHRFVEEYLRIAAKTGNGDYWKAIIDYHMAREVS